MNRAGLILQNLTQSGKRFFQLAIWKVRALNRKECELVEDIKRAKMDFLDVTKTENKGRGEIKIQDYTFGYSGDNVDERATGVV